MTTLQVFDPPMCCSTGVCGPNVNPALAQLAADLQWLKGLGVQVERFDLAQQPAAFRDNAAVRATLAQEGVDCLPLFRVDDVTVSKGVYPLAATGRMGRTDSSTGGPGALLPLLWWRSRMQDNEHAVH